MPKRSLNKKPQLIYGKALPSFQAEELEQSLLIFDQILGRRPEIARWLKKFPFRYAVKSGESLKELRNFPSHLEKILEITQKIPGRPLQIIAVGGGSVGDFAGFTASILKRGVRLTHIPSTWLAAIDSSHGGKTALNVSRFKNQMGTFYSADKIYLCRKILETQPVERAEEALGEVIKMALISGGSLWKKVSAVKPWNSSRLWAILPALIQAKYKIVAKDPFEKSGYRHILNLGHTLGHVFEAQLKLPHGKAVLAGLGFALQWSGQEKSLSTTLPTQIPLGLQQARLLRRLRQPQKFLLQDKKRVGQGKIRFVFVLRPGKLKIKEVSISEIVQEIQRQAW